MDGQPEGPLADALKACGVDRRLVTVEWDSLCQEDVLIFSGADFSNATLVGLADLHLAFPSRFVFETDSLQRAFEHVVIASPAMQKLRAESDREQKGSLVASGLSAFAAFDPDAESLSAFARRVEAACGFEQDQLLTVRGENCIVLDPANPGEFRRDAFGTVLALLEQSASGVSIFIAGRDEGES